MSAYRIHLWLIAGLGTTALCACAALIYYIRNYLLSHRKLKDTEAMAEQVILSYPASLIVTNPIGEVIFKNRRAEKILTYMSAQIPFQEWRGFDWSGLYKDLQAGKIIVDAERELLEPSGRLLPVNLSASPLWDSSGKCTGYLIVISDLSEMKRLKRRLAETQRLSALGHLATGLAHEIRNPLSSICGYACYLEEKLQSDPLGLATAKLLVDESRRLNNVLSELLQLAREPRLDIRTHPVSELLRKVRKVALPDAESRRINLTIAKESEERISASIDPDRMLQALLNLVLNAIQATPAGGDVLLSAEFLPAHSPVLPIELDQEEGWWRIQVRDSGRGMTEKELAQIFTPYFTTRANGTGLGLPIARRIVEAHDGLITAESKLGAGAVFSIYIPQKAKE